MRPVSFKWRLEVPRGAVEDALFVQVDPCRVCWCRKRKDKEAKESPTSGQEASELMRGPRSSSCHRTKSEMPEPKKAPEHLPTNRSEANIASLNVVAHLLEVMHAEDPSLQFLRGAICQESDARTTDVANETVASLSDSPCEYTCLCCCVIPIIPIVALLRCTGVADNHEDFFAL